MSASTSQLRLGRPGLRPLASRPATDATITSKHHHMYYTKRRVRCRPEVSYGWESQRDLPPSLSSNLPYVPRPMPAATGSAPASFCVAPATNAWPRRQCEGPGGAPAAPGNPGPWKPWPLKDLAPENPGRQRQHLGPVPAQGTQPWGREQVWKNQDPVLSSRSSSRSPDWQCQSTKGRRSAAARPAVRE